MGSRQHSAMAPKVKLTYFNLRAKGEPARLLLAYGGIKYQDYRVSFEDQTEWKAMKPKTPYGSLPLLEWDGVCIAQSVAIARFLAREVGLAGRNSLESAQIDEIVDAVNDIFQAGLNAVFSNDPAQMSKYEKETLPAGLVNIEKILESRGGQYMVGNALSWADLRLFDFCHSLPQPNCLGNFPLIRNLTERVSNIPNIKTWLESRPKSKL